MMRLISGVLFVGCFMAALLAGCGQGGPPAPAAAPQLTTSAELMATWLELPKAGPNNLDMASAQTIASRMLNTPEGLAPLLEILAKPEVEPVAKVLAVITLSPHVKPEMEPQLIAMTQTGQETTTRACATHLLGLLNTEGSSARVKQLLEDPEHRVKAAAVMILGARGETAVLESIPALWADPQTSSEDKDQMLLMLPETHVQQYLGVYQGAVLDHSLEPKARERLAGILGRVGDASAVPLLEEAAEKDPHSAVRVMARSAADAIQARLAGPVPPAPAAPAPEAAP